jgi:CubicO group peptidase (beta-lactamase class C family)
MHDAQTRVQSLLNHLVQEGKECGLQVAVYKDGALVIDAWAGVADGAGRRPVDGRTLFPVYSTTKGIAATVIHLLVERGKADYDMRIADCWPEFAARGKARITLRQALNHTAGLPQMPLNIGFAELCDWETMCAAIADLEPLWPAGTNRVYHAMTFGWIVGEVARRVDGRPFAQIVREDICQPLGIEDLYIGIPDSVEPRVATLDSSGDPPPPFSGIDAKAVPAWMGPLDLVVNRPDVRRACIPASNGIMSARAIARHYAALLPGGVDGITLLPPDRVRMATELQPLTGAQEQAPGAPIALGYFLMGEDNAAFGHAGYGGSVGFAESRSGIALGFAKNRCRPSPATAGTAQAIIDTVRESLARD